jgi:hypothetical protein
MAELPALFKYLIATPAARVGLSDTLRLEALVNEFASRSWQRPAPPTEPMLGDRLDVYVAVNRALDQVGWRRFLGRAVRGEMVPDAQTVAERARATLLPGVAERVHDDKLISEVERFLHSAAWPFDVLVHSP